MSVAVDRSLGLFFIVFNLAIQSSQYSSCHIISVVLMVATLPFHLTSFGSLTCPRGPMFIEWSIIGLHPGASSAYSEMSSSMLAPLTFQPDGFTRWQLAIQMTMFDSTYLQSYTPRPLKLSGSIPCGSATFSVNVMSDSAQIACAT